MYFLTLTIFFLFLSWISCPEYLSFGFLLLNDLMFVTLMPCIYVLLCGPKICNKDSCILYLVCVILSLLHSELYIILAFLSATV